MDIALRSRDGHEFKGSYYAPDTAQSGPAVLLIPNLGYGRASLSGLSTLLVARGYRVLAMDNSGQLRNVSRGQRGAPAFSPVSRATFDKLILDVPPAAEALRRQAGVAPQICLVGFGIGANLALEYACSSPDVGALALVMPGFGCEEIESLDYLAQYGKRPLVLIESKKRVYSDISRALRLINRNRNDGSKEQIILPREPTHVLTDLASGLEGTGPLLEWLSRVVPSDAR